MAFLSCLLYIWATKIRMVKLGIPKMTERLSGIASAILLPPRQINRQAESKITKADTEIT